MRLAIVFFAVISVTSVVGVSVCRSQQQPDDSLLIGIWGDYGGCLTRGSISEVQWKDERIQRMKEFKILGFNTMFLPLRDIEIEMAYSAGWLNSEMILLMSPVPNENTKTYSEYMNRLDSFLHTYGDDFRGVLIDEPSDCSHQWLDTSEGASRFEMLLTVLASHKLSLFITGYAYLNGNDKLGTKNYEFPAGSGRTVGVGMSHSGLFDAISFYYSIIEKSNVKVFVLDDTYGLPAEVSISNACDQRPVIELLSMHLPRERNTHPLIGGGGMFINLGYEPGAFKRNASRSGDPKHFAQLLAVFKHEHENTSSMNALFVYCSDLYAEMMNRLRGYYILYRAAHKGVRHGVAGKKSEAGTSSIYDAGLDDDPCNVFKGLITMAWDDFDTVIVNNSPHIVQRVDDGALFRYCRDTSDNFKHGFLDCLIHYLGQFPSEYEGERISVESQPYTERQFAFEQFIAPSHDEGYIRSVIPHFMECVFFRDLVCRLYHIRLKAIMYAIRKAKFIR